MALSIGDPRAGGALVMAQSVSYAQGYDRVEKIVKF